jgi:putative endonuclease
MTRLQREYCVYIMASKRAGTLYLGVTNDLDRRVYQHKSGLIEGFTKRYSVDRLVWFELYGDICLEDTVDRKTES